MAKSTSGLLTQLQRGWRRTNVTLVVLAFLFLSAALRLVYLQVIKGPQLAETARNNRIATFTIEAPRGPILDAEGHELATSTQVVHVGVNQVLIRDYVNRDEDDPEVIIGVGPAEAARQLAPLLGEDPAVLGGKM
ncbi:MAG: penicillin-binding protein 2, partial [Bowdeniella nasicola]|nr:penicillin-binding protein 2 [Bowdeniella nasicola]